MVIRVLQYSFDGIRRSSDLSIGFQVSPTVRPSTSKHKTVHHVPWQTSFFPTERESITKSHLFIFHQPGTLRSSCAVFVPLVTGCIQPLMAGSWAWCALLQPHHLPVQQQQPFPQFVFTRWPLPCVVWGFMRDCGSFDEEEEDLSMESEDLFSRK